MKVQTTLASPVGDVTLQATDKGLSYVGFAPKSRYPDGSNTHLERACEQLTEYFAGQRTCFDVALDTQGTPFQQAVWQLLCQIPFGETNTYGWMANKLENPKAVRAVGSANGKNPISIIVPCHRIIGANGKLTGYAGGLARKSWLLAHEGIKITQ
ncbi:methylated-DNA--[protein]-cysteine S-methyltransferase [Pseudoalteromonas sp. OOF1S-7]|uniref:methylated-DNA--[protein]-cysteine S-methyltransferase n=1 Tax=Pseudoalteromonas sp. OOF1S-7 TaxID=2917757 RepID=UPI001EF44878|nr:methylated-DNA--[protein]-cysteine S-methyltransferase [Pseudoalteromonas sp. OOF1S-7]MCG7534070.1 methylated-DNA--[protein]-cysteine S-methyltransferase [Pseudoalteromonas sp. OOF1S-7]